MITNAFSYCKGVKDLLAHVNISRYAPQPWPADHTTPHPSCGRIRRGTHPACLGLSSHRIFFAKPFCYVCSTTLELGGNLNGFQCTDELE